MKLSVFTVAVPDMTPEQLCSAAEAAGIVGIEWRCKETPEHVRKEAPSFWGNNRCTIDPRASEEKLASLAQTVRATGRRSLALAPYLSCGDLEGTERMFRIARSLGASLVRVGVPGYDGSRDFGSLFAEASAYLAEVEALAGDYGVKALVETHHRTIAPSASLAHRLVSRFDPDKVGVLYDPGNMVYEGFENYRMGFELLGPYLAHVHVKNAGWSPARGGSGAHPNLPQAEGSGGPEAEPLSPVEWTCGWRPIASGIVPWRQVLADLKAVGYDGWLGLEDFSGAYGSADMLRVYAAQMNEWQGDGTNG
ncbi:sugar phosphate isomerase/epimerase [Paenibacillus cisolokensis]|uniref:sugar phosphate isomerase/epimerase family protein n=1 Tax=Paenibacillus cisolokensis TaxID=1658519 RepID=UPI003D2B0F49